MSTTVVFLILMAVTILIIGGAIVHEKRSNKKRREGLQSEAEALGLSFSGEDDIYGHLQKRAVEFELFNKGRDRKILNIVVGETDRIGITIFDYHFTTGGGEHQQRNKRSVALMESEELLIPAFTLRPESMFAKLGAIVGMQDIDFDSHPEFSKRYLLKSDSEEQVREFFDDSILSMFEDRDKICVEAVPGKIIVYYAKRLPKPDQLKDLFAEALAIYGVLDDRVRAMC